MYSSNLQSFWNWFTEKMDDSVKLNAEFSAEDFEILKEISGWDSYFDVNKEMISLDFVSINESFLILLIQSEDEEYKLVGLGAEGGEFIIDFCCDISPEEVRLQGLVDWNNIIDVCEN